MIVFPCAKINLGLNVIAKRPDGYHDIETVFYPIPISDALELHIMDDGFPSEKQYDLKITGNIIEGNEDKNLVVKAYKELDKDYHLPRIHIHLYKNIPTGAGMGGGSSDGAFMIKALNRIFKLGLSTRKMEQYATRLGADCAFFINGQPSFASGIGDKLSQIDFNLNGYYIAIVKPSISISTAKAYSGITAKLPEKSIKQILKQPIETWRHELINDFEGSIFPTSQEIEIIKQKLYEMGAKYAAMSGSGSTVFGLFDHNIQNLRAIFPETFCCYLHL